MKTPSTLAKDSLTMRNLARHAMPPPTKVLRDRKHEYVRHPKHKKNYD
jgi:hypothetical protein